MERSTVPAADNLAQWLIQIHEELCAELEFVQKSQAQYYDQHRLPAPEFKKDQLIWLLRHNIKTTRPSTKLDHRRLGPYRIIEKIGSSAYLLNVPSYLSRLHPVFNVSLLEPYRDPSIFRPHSSPEAFQLADDPALSIQTIHDACKIGHRFEYFVRWKDLPESENSWIPLSDIPTSQNELIDRFHCCHPRAPHPHTIVLNQCFPVPPTTHSPSVSIELTPQTSSPHTDSMLTVPQASSAPLAAPMVPPAAARPASPPVIHQRLRSEYVPPIQTTTRTGRVSKPAQRLDPEY